MLKTSIFDSLKVCLLCNNTLIETRINSKVFAKQASNILETFCHYLKLRLETDVDSDSVKTLPFCEECSFSVYKLFKFHQEKTRLERHIQLMVIAMTMGMMDLLEQKHTDTGHQERDDGVVSAVRAAAIKYCNPSLNLTRWGDTSKRGMPKRPKFIKKEELPEVEEMSVSIDPQFVVSVSDYDSEEGRKVDTADLEEKKVRPTSRRSPGKPKSPWIRKNNQQYLYNGVTYVHVGDAYECKSCGTKCKNIRKMIAHIQALHKNERRLKFEKRVEESGFNRGFQKNLWIKRPNQEYTYCQVRYCHVGDGYECKACGANLGNIRAMKKHIQTEHKGKNLFTAVLQPPTSRPRPHPPSKFNFVVQSKEEKFVPSPTPGTAQSSKSSQIQRKWIRKEYQQYTYNKVVYCHVGNGYQCGSCGVKCKNIRAMKKHIQIGHKTGTRRTTLDTDDTSNTSLLSASITPVPVVVKSEEDSFINYASSDEGEQSGEHFLLTERKPRKTPRVRGENQRYKYNGVVYHFIRDGYECKACGAKGRNIRAMKKHIQLVHTPTQTLPKLEDIQVAPDKYEYEGFSFEKVGEEFKCGSCVFSQDSCAEIVGHIRECHIVGNDHLMEVRPGEYLYAGKYTTLKIGENYVCGDVECKYETKSLRGALIHVRRSHIGDPKEKCICEICGKAFAYPKILQRHLKNHPRLSLDCKYCGKKCPGQYCLKVHEYTHEGDAAKKLQCHICGKKFLFRQQLIGHEAAHAGEKNHECSECGKKFLWQSSLSTHRKAWHSNHKEFACEVCGATFRYKDSVRRHIIGVHKGVTSADQIEQGTIPTYVRKRKRSDVLQDQGQVVLPLELPVIPAENSDNPTVEQLDHSTAEDIISHEEQVQTENVNVDFSLWA